MFTQIRQRKGPWHGVLLLDTFLCVLLSTPPPHSNVYLSWGTVWRWSYSLCPRSRLTTLCPNLPMLKHPLPGWQPSDGQMRSQRHPARVTTRASQQTGITSLGQHENLCLLPGNHILKRCEHGDICLQSLLWGSRGRWIPGACWPVIPAYRPTREPVSTK